MIRTTQTRSEVLSIEWACTNAAPGLGLILRLCPEATLSSEQGNEIIQISK